ncbi:MAG TPA: hypothetical protein VKS03_02145 [Thermoanaerobaculia bacterium]|nr:hypothetical protein [Thermoanaerobaculia bacterium]
MTDLIANPAPNRASSVFTEELLEELRQIGYLKTVLGINPDETPRWG